MISSKDDNYDDDDDDDDDNSLTKVLRMHGLISGKEWSSYREIDIMT